MPDKMLIAVHEQEAPGITLSVTAHPIVNLALVHNGVPVIQQIAVTNTGGEPLSGLRVVAHIDGLLGDDTPEWSAVLPAVPPGATLGHELIRELVPARAHLDSLREAYDATLRVSVQHDDAEVLQIAAPLTVLAASEWFAAPFCFESLASFVEPNSPAVTAVLSDAAAILAAQTGDSSLQGYQSGPKRAGLIAAAIYAALAARDIRYINPPASFEQSGQKVRTPAQVIDDRMGTCLDLSATYAACLEQSGLYPLLWVIRGHAFVGFLREAATLAAPLVLEPNKMLNLAESGRAVILEAAFYGGAEAPTFREATEFARRYLGDPGRLWFVLDVAAARRAGVKPLPRSGQLDSSITDAPRRKPAAADLSLPGTLTEIRDTDQVLDTTDRAPVRVKRWKSALLDLSTRNRLLNLRPSREVIPLMIPPEGLPILDDLVHAGKKITLRPGDDFSGVQVLSGVRSAHDLDPAEVRSLLTGRRELFSAVSSERYTSTFKYLQRTARTLLEETGSTNLYMTFGSLIHHTASGKEAPAPLFVLPVRVVGGTGNSRFEVLVDTTGIAAPNHCLIEWLRVVHNVAIPALSSPPTDDSGIDIRAALSQIRQGLIDNDLDFRIDETATIAICKFGTLGLWQDLQLHWDQLAASPLVHHLVYQAGSTFVDPGATSDLPLGAIDIDETGHPLPVPYDGSQLKAIEASAQGRTFVLEGPPGTGKSQTITNLIARNLAAGRTVLFVAEKQAALDVVRRRLDAVGLAPFTLDLHGTAQKSANIRQQLKDSLEFRGEHNQRRWDTSVALWKSRHRRLADYPSAVHAPNNTGDSLWEAADFVAASPDVPYYSLPSAFVRTCTDAELSSVRDALSEFSRTALPSDLVTDSPWTLAVSIDDQALPGSLHRLQSAFDQVTGDDCALRIASTLDDPAKLAIAGEWLNRQGPGDPLTPADLAELSTQEWRNRRDAAWTRFRTFRSSSAELTRYFHTTFLDRGDHGALIQLIADASSGVLRKKKRQEEAVVALRATLHPGVDLPLAHAQHLLTYVPSVRAERTEVQTIFRSVYGRSLPTTWDPADPAADHQLQAMLSRLRIVFEFSSDHAEVWTAVNDAGRPAPTTGETLRQTAAAWTDWARVLGCTDAAQQRWRAGRAWLAAWRESQPVWVADVQQSGASIPCRRTRLQQQLMPLRAAGLGALADALLTGAAPYADAPLRFDAGIAHTSIAERLDSGGLTDFAPTVQNGHVADFVAASHDMRDLLAGALSARLAERRPFDPSRLTGKFGTLRRALDGKRNAMSVRNLVREFGPEILSAAPCFLVSPSSLAQYVAPGSIEFDVVVFDEASQVTVAQAVGALGRARSAVIVGDSKQMPPTSIGMVSSADGSADDDDDADTAPEDLDSILTEAVESGIERLQLNWHYRSQDESLIAFSNEKYYDAKLASLPSPGRREDAGVEFRRVNGHFNREDKKTEFRTNRVEAEAIVTEIERLVAAETPQQSIGVVTFNRQQQDLILNLLEGSKNPVIGRLLAPDTVDGLFVKNLENVQGDERDVILFSTAFAKPAGKDQLPLNFGPLSRAGGEKRLNVAITRARRKVVMFSSFDPADIDLGRTSSVGLAHLRGYMEAAIAQTAGTSVRTDRPQSALEIDLTGALRKAGLDVQPNYGMSEFVVDIAVKAPGSPEWQVAIMLDGPRWRDRETVTDRDVMPGLLETLMSWDSVVRVWLPEWLKDPAGVVDRVRGAVDTAEAERLDREAAAASAAATSADPVEIPAPQPPEPARVGDQSGGAPLDRENIGGVSVVHAGALPGSGPAANVDIEPQSLKVASVTAESLPPLEIRDAQTPAESPHAVPYESLPDTPLGTREELDGTGSGTLQATIRTALQQTIDIEGPIELDALCSRVVRRFGLKRATGPRTAFVVGLVPSNLIHKDPLGSFVWPASRDPKTWRVFRTPAGESKRPIDEIAPEEFINALVWSAAQDPGEFEPVVRNALRQLGVNRLTDGIRDRARACLGRAVEAGRLRFDGGVYRSA
ncbi:DUF3320 domain-containing protein [Gordonia sp. PP30]|uniref:DUF3320 domain-containing protein n=1 Tax=Gordonia sp. PP30 TaxID=2935861 RepID=UPI001FFEF4BE|nr:DUF3320 domain-containing protein [Gordonia sp. PP30]UQE73750.1 DUF3320 domain-containing protein [Gordonia sp. PP30]